MVFAQRADAQNMLARILDRPGAGSVPQSPGEAISRFRDDANNAGEFTSQIPFLIGQAVFAIIALGIMLNINARITLFAYIPFIIVIVLANKAMKNVEKYREASRKAAEVLPTLLAKFTAQPRRLKWPPRRPTCERFERLNETRRKAASP